MRILYGVQGTGNGHLTRARAMQKALADQGVTVDWVFSGRSREAYFDMDAFGDYQSFRGLSFVTQQGKVDLRKTFANVSLRQMYRDIRLLDLARYDLVVTDFEPVTAWAARQAGVPAIGIGHQYAFDWAIPKADYAVTAQAVMRWFAPVSVPVGLHWHSFSQPVLPPLIEPASSFVSRTETQADTTLVYLPFEDSQRVLSTLQQVSHRFIYHCADITPGCYRNVQVKGFSRTGFQHSLHRSSGVICNAGFELVSEALTLGRRILVRPLQGQFEQASNAMALTQLQLAQSTDVLDVSCIHRFLSEGRSILVEYPQLAPMLAEWLCQNPHGSLDQLIERAWRDVRMPVPIPKVSGSEVTRRARFTLA